MNEMIKYRTDIANQTDEQRQARERMALFPARAEVLYIAPDIWVVSLLDLVHNECSDVNRSFQARGAARGQAVRVPWHPEALPAHAGRARFVSTTSSSGQAAVPPTDLHLVSPVLLPVYDNPISQRVFDLLQATRVLHRAVPHEPASPHKVRRGARRLVPVALQGRVCLAHRARRRDHQGNCGGGREGAPRPLGERGGGTEGEGCVMSYILQQCAFLPIYIHECSVEL